DAVTGKSLDQVLQRRHSPGQSAGHDAATGLDRDPGRVVPAILEPSQSAEQNRRGVALPDVTDDAAHSGIPCEIRLQQRLPRAEAELRELRLLAQQALGEVLTGEDGTAARTHEVTDALRAPQARSRRGGAKVQPALE